MSYAIKPKEEVFPVAMGQLCLLVKDEQAYFEEKYKAKIEKLKDTTKDSDVRAQYESLLSIVDGQGQE